jgi:ketosteroid isomerase-like protein
LSRLRAERRRDTAGVTEPEKGSSAELARRVLAALSRGDTRGFAELVHPEIEIHTARGVRRGVDEAEEWAQKRYEHLERQYAIDRMKVHGETVLAWVRTQYVWRESGLVGDEEPIAIELAFKDAKLIRWTYREELAGAGDGSGRADAG